MNISLDKLYTGMVAEYRFHPTRRFRFDFAIPEKKLAIEIEGGIWLGRNGAHSSGKGILRDMEKNNLAVLEGWRILRVTPQQVKNGEAHNLIDRALGIK